MECYDFFFTTTHRSSQPLMNIVCSGWGKHRAVIPKKRRDFPSFEKDPSSHTTLKRSRSEKPK